MNGHNRRCQCTSCDVERVINDLTERVAKLEQQVRDNSCTISVLKSVPDPEFDWGKVDATYTLPEGYKPAGDSQFATIKQQIESDRANDKAYFKARAAAYQPVRIDYDAMEVVPDVVWEKEVPALPSDNQPMEPMTMHNCRWRTEEPKKLKSDCPITFQNDDGPDAQPIVIGGES